MRRGGMTRERLLGAGGFRGWNPGAGGSVKLIRLCLMVAAVVLPLACAAPPAPRASMPPPTPTPLPLSRTNPNIIEEDATHIVERFPKDEYIRVDDRHFKHLL